MTWFLSYGWGFFYLHYEIFPGKSPWMEQILVWLISSLLQTSHFLWHKVIFSVSEVLSLEYFHKGQKYSSYIYFKVFGRFFFFAEADLAWANICCQSSSFCLRKRLCQSSAILYVVTTAAWLLVSGVGPCLGSEPRLQKQSAPNLTTRPPGQPLYFVLLMVTSSLLKKLFIFSAIL